MDGAAFQEGTKRGNMWSHSKLRPGRSARGADFISLLGRAWTVAPVPGSLGFDSSMTRKILKINK